MSLKPANFFEQNPSNDVPRSNQSVNKSTLHTAEQESCCLTNGVGSLSVN